MTAGATILRTGALATALVVSAAMLAQPAPADTNPAAGSSASPAPAGEHPATCVVTLADKTQIRIPWDNPGCAPQRRAFASHPPPATCKVTLADKSEIDIPWSNEGCAPARRAWNAAAKPLVFYDYDGEKVDGHPQTCTVSDERTSAHFEWDGAQCAPARAQWASEPDWMHIRMWDSHDAAPENLIEGHPKYCDPIHTGPARNTHFAWESKACDLARIKWHVVVDGGAPPHKKT